MTVGASSSAVAGTLGGNWAAIRGDTLQKFEEIAVGGKGEGGVFGDDGFAGLHICVNS